MRYLLYCEKLCVTLFTLWLKKMNKSECDNNSFLIMRKIEVRRNLNYY